MTTISPEATEATETAPTTTASRLRTVLRTNAIVTSVSGVLLAAAAGTFADILDVDTIAVRLVGAALVPFALAVGWASTVGRDRLRTLSLAIGVADVAWVVGTVLLVVLGAFSTEGGILALLVGAMVATFAVLELRGASALRTS